MRRGNVLQFLVPIVGITQVLPVSSHRRSIIFTAITNAMLVTDQPGASLLGFIVVNPQAPVELTWEKHGDIVCHPWFAQASGGAGTLGILVSEESD